MGCELWLLANVRNYAPRRVTGKSRAERCLGVGMETKVVLAQLGGVAYHEEFGSDKNAPPPPPEACDSGGQEHN